MSLFSPPREVEHVVREAEKGHEADRQECRQVVHHLLHGSGGGGGAKYKKTNSWTHGENVDGQQGENNAIITWENETEATL